MSKRVMLKAACLLLLAPFVLTGCRHTQGSAPKEEILFVLFDTSGSTQGQRDLYLEDFKSALDSLRDHKNRLLIVGDVISYNTLQTAEYRIKAQVEEDKGLFGNPMMRKQQQEAQFNRAFKQVKDALKLVYPATDIMSSFKLPEKFFRGHKNAEKRLIVFSDLVEQSSRYNFYSERLTPGRIQQIIQREKSDNLLPNLSGVKVWLVGIGKSADKSSSSTRVQHLEDFWLAYFKAAGADIDSSRIAARLINFE